MSFAGAGISVRLVRLACAIGVLFVLASCAGNGCSCAAPIPGGFPKDQRHNNMIQARVTRGGLDFIQANSAGLINSALPMAPGTPAGTITIPPSGCPAADTRLCCAVDMPAAKCGQIKLDLIPADNPLVLATADPNRLSFTLHARLKTLEKLRFSAKASIITLNKCDLELDTTSSGSPFIELKGDMVFTTHDPGANATNLNTTRVDVQNLVINNLETGDLNISGGFSCSAADFFLTFFIGTLRDTLTTQINDAIKNGLCQPCDSGMVSECAPWGDACTDKICMRGGKCIQKLGLDGRMNVGALLASFSPGLSANMDVYDVAGNYSKVQAGATGGMSLGVIGGNHAPVHDTCVPVKTAPPVTPITESPVFAANTHAEVPYAYHIGVGVHEQFLNNAGYAMYDAGGLCLNVGTKSVDLLASDTFNVIIGSLKDLTHGVKSPLFLSLRPQNPPALTLGAGTIMVNAMTGEKTIVDPLITVDLKDLAIDFHVLVEERYTRVFTMTADVILPLAIDVDMTGKLVPLLGDTTEAFKNIRVTGSELLAEPAADIAMKFPAVLGLALPFLSSSLSGFELPDVLGMKLVVKPGGIKRVDGKYLGLFTTLATAMPASSPVETTARLARLVLPEARAFDLNRVDDYKGLQVVLDLGGSGLDGTARGLEWSVRVDNGFWSLYSERPLLTLSRPELMLQGHHKVEVRARQIGESTTLDPTPAVVDVLIDVTPPEVKMAIDTQHDRLRVEAKDLVTPAAKLEYAVRLRATDGFGAWVPELPSLDLTVLDPEGVAVRVRDEAGNVTELDGATAFHGRAPAGAGGCGCNAGGRSGGGFGAGWLLGLAVLGFVVVQRRRRLGMRRMVMLTGLAVALSALGLGAAGCGGSGSGNGDDDTTEQVLRGSTGRFSDLAVSGTRVVASAYESSFGDLVIVERASDGTLKYTPIDGVPDEMPTLRASGYRGGIQGVGDDVGYYTSLVLDSSKKVRVAYQDVTNKSLKYAAEPASGTKYASHTVEMGGGAKGELGRYAGMTLDAMGNPVIAYMATGVPDGMNGFKNQLRVAHAKVAKPAAATDWTITLVEEAKIPCQNLCATGMACVEMTDQCAPEVTTCTASCGSGTACVGGACVAVRKASAIFDIAEGPGLWPQPVVSGGKVAVVYYHRFADHGELKLALENGAMWTVSKIDGDVMRDRGMWPSVAVATDGTLHVAYQDAQKDDLYYVTVKPGSPAGTPELVDDGERMGDRPHAVGASAAIFLDGAQPKILYQDQHTVDLRSAKRGTDGMWTKTDLEKGDSGFGFYTSVAVDAGKAWYSDFVFEGTDDPFGRIDIKTVP